MKLRRGERPEKKRSKETIIRWRGGKPFAMGDILVKVYDNMKKIGLDGPVVSLNMLPNGIKGDVFLDRKSARRLHRALSEYLRDA